MTTERPTVRSTRLDFKLTRKNRGRTAKMRHFERMTRMRPMRGEPEMRVATTEAIPSKIFKMTWMMVEARLRPFLSVINSAMYI